MTREAALASLIVFSHGGTLPAWSPANSSLADRQPSDSGLDLNMQRLTLTGLILLSASLSMTTMAAAQTTRQLQRERERLRGRLELQDAEISHQRVQRQSEVIRLEGRIDDLSDRLQRLERSLLGNSLVAAVTVPEAEAALKLAKLQFEQLQQRSAGESLSPVERAAAELQLERARGQLVAAKAAADDRLIQLELNVLYAQEDLRDLTREQQNLQRLVAKGYTGSEALQDKAVAVGIAKKRLELAQLRMKTQKQLNRADAPSDDSADAPTPDGLSTDESDSDPTSLSLP